jgi:hypothetical protein
MALRYAAYSLFKRFVTSTTFLVDQRMLTHRYVKPSNNAIWYERDQIGDPIWMEDSSMRDSRSIVFEKIDDMSCVSQIDISSISDLASSACQ